MSTRAPLTIITMAHMSRIAAAVALKWVEKLDREAGL